MNILGVRFGHDSSAALMMDGKIIADVAEERFSRIKNDTSFPVKSIEFCLKQGGITSLDLDIIVSPSKSYQPEFGVFFDLENKIQAFGSLKSRIKEKLIPRNLPVLPLYREQWQLKESCRFLLREHHKCHAASAHFTSDFPSNEDSLTFVLDGIGDGKSVSIWKTKSNNIELLHSEGGEGSLGWFYANATEGMGWRHGSEEWKLMGLAPYGTPKPGILDGLHPVYEDGVLVKGYDFGSFGRWNDHGANHYHNDAAFDFNKIFKEVGAENYAAEVQRLSEELAFSIILPWLKKTGINSVKCAGGFFMNVKFNQKLWDSGAIERLWIYPNPGDAGLAAGACLLVNSEEGLENAEFKSLYTGPIYSDDAIEEILINRMISYKKTKDIAKDVASLLDKNYVVGWFQGRMEAGPRALGSRSILMSPCDPRNKDRINAKVKYREAFRPFCPSIQDEDYFKILNTTRKERFMVSSFQVNDNYSKEIPAVVHEDNTARPQYVEKEVNPLYWDLLNEFKKLSGFGVLLNTSFNIKGEPIVCNPREAIKCFYDTGIDVLVMGSFIILKDEIRSI